jgi:hypothetical protein
MAQFETFLQQNPQVASSPEYQIPVWIFLIDNEQGDLQIDEIESAALVSDINPWFQGLFEFVVCGTTRVVDNTICCSIVTPNQIPTAINALPESNDDNCLRIFFHIGAQGGAFGYAQSPAPGSGQASTFELSGVQMVVHGHQKFTLAHEIGHFFGLPHTFVGSQFVDLDPDCSTNLSCYCHTTGDLFCDTPADREHFGSTNCSTINLGTPNTDPNGVPYVGTLSNGIEYKPDVTLLMSYHSACGNRFSLQQRSYMRASYLNAGLAPLRNNLGQCSNSNPVNWGKVEMACGSSSSPVYLPMPGLPVNMYNITSYPSFTPQCAPITNAQGFYIHNSGTAPCSNGGRYVVPLREPGVGTPQYLEYKEGVTTLDLLLISRHILGLEPFDSPFKTLAADVNNSATVTAFDIVMSRKLILDQINSFPSGSWRYLSDHFLEDPNFSTTFYQGNLFGIGTVNYQNVPLFYLPNGQAPTNVPNKWVDGLEVVIPSTMSNVAKTWKYKGVKVGDVNCSNQLEPEAPEFSAEVFTDENNIKIEDGKSKKIDIVLLSKEPIAAWQLGVGYSTNELTVSNSEIGSELIIDGDETNIIESGSQGEFRSVWVSPDGTDKELDNTVLMSIEVTGNSESISLTNLLDIKSSEIPTQFFNDKGELLDVSLLLRESEKTEERSNNEYSYSSSVRVIPQPYSSNFYLSFVSQSEEVAQIDIISPMGQLIERRNVLLSKGMNQVFYDNLDDLPDGLYYYKIDADSIKYSGIVSKN